MIELITASAGSGKTYTLAKKYIGILLEAYIKDGSKNAREFEHILAVTFTNKATAEMKERILQELYILSQNPALSGYYEDFCSSYDKKTVSDPDTWKRILYTLLHNYSRFSVSTIDTFFQSVLRHFAREIGEFNSYRIELDRDALVSEAADNLLSGISSAEDPVFKVVSALTGEKISGGKKFSPKRELTEIAMALMGGEFIRALESVRTGSAYDELVDEIKKDEPKFSKRVSDFEETLKTDLSTTITSLEKSAKQLNDCFVKYKQIINGTYRLAGTVSSYAADVRIGKLSSKAFDHLENYDFFKAGADIASTRPDFETICSEFLNLHLRKNRVMELQKYIPYLKFTVCVFKAFADVTDSANVKCLDDTTKILSQIIAGSDAPFIYEKIGTRFDHYLLDEFQDTSHVQWENFKPLLAEANSTGGHSLVVGDVKQSIYRFRNSDYTILDSEVPKDFAGYISKTPLNSNFRSGRNIVEFNNDLFATLAERVDARIAENNGPANALKDIYLLQDESGKYVTPHTVGQVVKKDFDGYVHYESFRCATSDELEDKIYPQVVSIVKDLCGRGVKKNDILILVKGKKQGSHIAEDLLREGIGVYSDDSLFVSSNAIARKLLSVLHHMDNRKDQISKAIVDSLGENFLEEGGTIVYSTLVELCEKVIARLKAVYCTTPDGEREFSGSIPYLSSLVDIASVYEADYGNSLHAFLEYFDRKEAKIASAASDEAVRIMTIHKSKGLAGEFVIVPFANRAVLFDSQHNRKWSECDDVPLPDGSRDLVYYASLSKSNPESAFYKAYNEEYKLRCIDAMNLLYVAFTRAQHGLYILEGKTDKQGENLAGIATGYLEGRNDGRLVSSDDSGMEYRIGDLDATVADYLAPKVESNLEKKRLLDDLHRQERMTGDYSVFESRASVRNSVKASEFFDGLRPDGEKCESDSRLKGILQHAILSAVHTVDDVDAAVEGKWQEGVLEGTKEDAKAYLKARIDAVSAYGWYDADAAVVTEEGMLVKTARLQKNGDGTDETPVATRVLPDGTAEYIVSRRPDRIVVHSDGSVDIVDYKFTGAADANLSKYRQQVSAYCNWYRALPGCGDCKVTGYIWYVNSDTVHTV